jgi:DNA-binding transcriptional LysR family regulator
LQESLSQVFESIETACDEVRLAPQEQILAIYCAASFAVKWLGPRLPEFVKAYPDITIRLTSGAEQIDLTRTKELDVVISYNEPPTRKGVVLQALGQENIVPMCAPRLLSTDMSARQQMPELVLIESQLSRVKWSNWLALNGLTLPNRPRPSFDRAAMSISAAADGMGVALESTRLAEREITRGDLVIVGADEFEPVLQEIHFLSYRSVEHKLHKVAAFRDWLLSQTELQIV